MKRIIGWGITLGGLAWLGWVIAVRVEEVQEARANPEVVVIPPAAVRVVPVQETTLGQEVQATGEVRARAVVAVFPKLGGRALEVLVDVGARVEAGQALVTLDEGDLGWRVKQAEAGLKAGSAGVRQATAQLELAETELARAEKLFAEKALSEAEVERARAGVRLAEAGVAAAGGQVAIAEAGLGMAEEAASWASVTAPIAGVVSKRYATVGQMLGPQGPVFELVDDGRLDVVVDLDPSVAAAVSAGARAEAVVEGVGGPRWALTLRHVAPAVDMMTRRVRAEFELVGAGSESDGEIAAGRRVLANMTAEVIVTLGGDADARLVAPVGAVVRLPEGRSVYVVRDGKAVRVAVDETAGASGGDRVALKGGDAADAARPDDKVIVEGQGDLRAGAEVRIASEAPAAPDAAPKPDAAPTPGGAPEAAPTPEAAPKPEAAPETAPGHAEGDAAPEAPKAPEGTTP